MRGLLKKGDAEKTQIALKSQLKPKGTQCL